MRTSVKLESSKGLTGAGGSASERTLMAVGGRPQPFAAWASPEGCLSVLMTWQLVALRASDPRESVRQKPNRSFAILRTTWRPSCHLPLDIIALKEPLDWIGICSEPRGLGWETPTPTLTGRPEERRWGIQTPPRERKSQVL